jgi:hypothetical protein
MNDKRKITTISYNTYNETDDFSIPEKYIIFDPADIPLTQIPHEIRPDSWQIILSHLRRECFNLLWLHTPKYISVVYWYRHKSLGTQDKLVKIPNVCSWAQYDFVSNPKSLSGFVKDNAIFIFALGFDECAGKRPPIKRLQSAKEDLQKTDVENVCIIELELDTSEKTPFYRQINI